MGAIGPAGPCNCSQKYHDRKLPNPMTTTIAPKNTGPIQKYSERVRIQFRGLTQTFHATMASTLHAPLGPGLTPSIRARLNYTKGTILYSMRRHPRPQGSTQIYGSWTSRLTSDDGEPLRNFSAWNSSPSTGNGASAFQGREFSPGFTLPLAKKSRQRVPFLSPRWIPFPTVSSHKVVQARCPYGQCVATAVSTIQHMRWKILLDVFLLEG